MTSKTPIRAPHLPLLVLLGILLARLLSLACSECVQTYALSLVLDRLARHHASCQPHTNLHNSLGGSLDLLLLLQDQFLQF